MDSTNPGPLSADDLARIEAIRGLMDAKSEMAARSHAEAVRARYWQNRKN